MTRESLAAAQPSLSTTTPLVSVVIPAYRRPAYLARAIESVVAQTIADWELIVVENGDSRDGRAVVERFAAADRRIRYVYEPAAGGAHARNVGIRLSRGAFVAFLDDDDEWLPEKLDRQLACFDGHPRVGLVTSEVWTIDGEGRITGRGSASVPTPTFETLLAWDSIWSLSCVMVRRDCFDAVGLFNPAHPVANDYDFYFRLATRYELRHLPEPLLRYRRHEGNVTADLEPLWQDIVRTLEAVAPLAPSRRSRGLLRRAIARYAPYWYGVASDRIAQGDVAGALPWLVGAVRCDALVGLRLGWGRPRLPLLRALRPYAAIAYCWAAGALRRRRPVPCHPPKSPREVTSNA